MASVFSRPRFIITNISRKALNILGLVKINPGVTFDLFDRVEPTQIHDSFILKALEAPWGELYQEVSVKRTLRIDVLELTTAASVNFSPAVDINSNPMKSYIQLAEDFLPDDFHGSTLWSTVGAGGGAIAAATSGPSLVGASGVVGFSVAVTPSSGLLRHGLLTVPLGYGTTTLDMRVRPSTTLASGTEDYFVRFGFGNQTASATAPTAGLNFVYNRSVSTNWLTEQIFGEVTVTKNTGVPVVAGVYVNCKLFIDYDGNKADFYISDVLRTSHDLTSVTKAEQTVRYEVSAQMIKTLGSSARTFFIDSVWLSKELNRS